MLVRRIRVVAPMEEHCHVNMSAARLRQLVCFLYDGRMPPSEQVAFQRRLRTSRHV